MDQDADRAAGPVEAPDDEWDESATPDTPPPPVAAGRHRASRTRIGVGVTVAVLLVVGGLVFTLPQGGATPSGLAGSPTPSVGAAGQDATTEPAGLIAPTGAGPAPTTPRPTATPSPRPTATLTTGTGAGDAPTSAAQTSTAPPAWTTLTVRATKVLRRGESVQTNRTRLLMQSDGDLIILDEFQAVRWRAGTAGSGDHAVFQDDGHFVVYDVDNHPRWSSKTAGHNGAVLVLAADGNVNIVFLGTVIWTSNTAH